MWGETPVLGRGQAAPLVAGAGNGRGIGAVEQDADALGGAHLLGGNLGAVDRHQARRAVRGLASGGQQNRLKRVVRAAGQPVWQELVLGAEPELLVEPVHPGGVGAADRNVPALLQRPADQRRKDRLERPLRQVVEVGGPHVQRPARALPPAHAGLSGGSGRAAAMAR